MAPAAPLKGEYPAHLTPRQRQIARMVVHGASRVRVAHDLGISYDTVREHCYRIFRVLGVRTSVELAVWYWRRRAAREYLRGYADCLAGRAAVPPDD